MGRYERVDDAGNVVETSYAPDGTYEDTRLGLAALENANGWRVATEPAPDDDPAPSTPPAASATAGKPTRKRAG
ncbi:hypothetical protein [Nonomuraea sp. NPDC050310]|uniref:hypothetical protein n=1 Tax=Nonomuraea sp. NPDC050310 TaxID=3154935 RepID=UPI0033DAEF24